MNFNILFFLNAAWACGLPKSGAKGKTLEWKAIPRSWQSFAWRVAAQTLGQAAKCAHVRSSAALSRLVRTALRVSEDRT